MKITELRFERRSKPREINMTFGIAFYLGTLKEMTERLGYAMGRLDVRGRQKWRSGPTMFKHDQTPLFWVNTVLFKYWVAFGNIRRHFLLS